MEGKPHGDVEICLDPFPSSILQRSSIFAGDTSQTTASNIKQSVSKWATETTPDTLRNNGTSEHHFTDLCMISSHLARKTRQTSNHHRKVKTGPRSKYKPPRGPSLQPPPSIVNQPQLLPHFPPPRLHRRPFRRLRLAVLIALAARLQGLQQHAGVEESICTPR